jgi:anaerobic selenocysteine-containing dehydrogenase
VVWGCDPASSLSSSFNDIVNALGKGTKLIVIDPIKSELAEKADLWLQVRPGTDLALALSMINVIVTEELYDKEFVRNWTIGFGELKGHVQDYSPDTVAEITWLDKEQIIQAARVYASNKPACIQWGNGIETNVNSIQTCRAISILRALTGNLGIPGGFKGIYVSR